MRLFQFQGEGQIFAELVKFGITWQMIGSRERVGLNIMPRYGAVFIEDEVEDVSFGMGQEGEVLGDGNIVYYSGESE